MTPQDQIAMRLRVVRIICCQKGNPIELDAMRGLPDLVEEEYRVASDPSEEIPDKEANSLAWHPPQSARSFLVAGFRSLDGLVTDHG